MKPETQLKLQALLTEYGRIKDEIIRHSATQQTILNFVILLLLAEMASLAQMFMMDLQPPPPLILNLLLIAPIPFALLSLYHTSYTMRIHKLASYMDGELKEKIEKIVGEGTLRTRSFNPTPNILVLPNSLPDGRISYISLFGLKALPQLLPLIA